MKHMYVWCSLIAAFLFAWTNLSGQNLTVEGRIGIGTTSPVNKLDVNGEIQLSNTSLPLGLTTELEGGSTPVFNFDMNFRTKQVFSSSLGAAFRIDARSNAGDPLFQWLRREAGDNGAGDKLMVLNTNGNVGIGINLTDPQARLDVDGTVRFRNLPSSTTGAVLGATFNGDVYELDDIFLDDGNLGISTFAPGAKLAVENGTDVSANPGGYLMLGSFNGVNIAMDNDEIQAQDGNSLTNLNIQRAGGNTILNQNGGSVGIGTNTPNGKLHVNGGDVLLQNGGSSLSMRIGEIFNGSTFIAQSNSTAFDLPSLGTISFSDRVVVTQGNVGIGDGLISPQAKLHVDGTVRLQNLPTGSGDAVVIDGAGNLSRSTSSINVNALIEDLQKENEALKARLVKIEAMLSSSANATNTTTTTLTSAILQQNTPNPFNEATTINYFIPEGTKQASIQVMDQNGRIIETIPIQATGKGQITLQANLLSAGTYSYSLVLSGQVMETKQMVLTH